MPYCSPEDLLTGDVPLAGKYGNGTSFCHFAADEIDAQIGHIYETPIQLDDTPANRPARLLLKKINILLASGRIILDMAAGGEDDSLHSYGRSMVREGLDLLRLLSTEKIEIPGAVRIETGEVPDGAPRLVNDDPYSLVEGFYSRFGGGHSVPLPGRVLPMRPYDDLPQAGA